MASERDPKAKKSVSIFQRLRRRLQNKQHEEEDDDRKNRRHSAPSASTPKIPLDVSPFLRPRQFFRSERQKQPLYRIPKPPKSKKFPHWWDHVDSVFDYEEAWIFFREHMQDVLFEYLVIVMPYMSESLFYNLNACFLKQKKSKKNKLRVFQPAGPLHRLCSIVTSDVYQKIATSRPYGVSPWFSNEYKKTYSTRQNGVFKEIELNMRNISRAVSEEIPKKSYRVNPNTLYALWTSDDKSFDMDDVLRTPTAPGTPPTPPTTIDSPLDDEVFQPIAEMGKVLHDFNIYSPLSDLPVATSTPRTPPPELNFSNEVKLFWKGLRSIYVIHELVFAETVELTIRIEDQEHTYQPPKYLRNKRAFPIGFSLTRYEIDYDGWLVFREIIRGAEVFANGWNVVANVPWPPKPPEPIILPRKSDETSKESTSSQSPGETGSSASGSTSSSMRKKLDELFEADADNITMDLDELVSNPESSGEITMDLDELVKNPESSPDEGEKTDD